MNNPKAHHFHTDAATVDVLETADALQATFKGTLDILQPEEFLEPIFNRLHGDAVSRGLKRVEVDISGLSFLNSSGIKSFANWIRRQATMAPAEQYAIQVNYADTVTWQKATLKAMQAMTRGALALVVVPAGGS